MIAPAAADIRAFVKKKKASIFVCGRLEMGAAVHEGLKKILGEAALEKMVSEGRYRRDIY